VDGSLLLSLSEQQWRDMGISGGLLLRFRSEIDSLRTMTVLQLRSLSSSATKHGEKSTDTEISKKIELVLQTVESVKAVQKDILVNTVVTRLGVETIEAQTSPTIAETP